MWLTQAQQTGPHEPNMANCGSPQFSASAASFRHQPKVEAGSSTVKMTPASTCLNFQRTVSWLLSLSLMTIPYGSGRKRVGRSLLRMVLQIFNGMSLALSSETQG